MTGLVIVCGGAVGKKVAPIPASLSRLFHIDCLPGALTPPLEGLQESLIVLVEWGFFVGVEVIANQSDPLPSPPDFCEGRRERVGLVIALSY